MSSPATDQPLAIPRPDWVISDTHLGHDNILEYCPWRQTWARNVAEHDAAIIAAWRATVKPDEWVLHLGDVALGDRDRLPDLRRQLPGKIILVRGNHDWSLATMRSAGFEIVCSAVVITDGTHEWVGRHNPAAFSTREAQRCARLLHGHTHGNGYSANIHPAIRAKARDCSMDGLRSIFPISYDSITWM